MSTCKPIDSSDNTRRIVRESTEANWSHQLILSRRRGFVSDAFGERVPHSASPVGNGSPALDRFRVGLKPQFAALGHARESNENNRDLTTITGMFRYLSL